MKGWKAAYSNLSNKRSPTIIPFGKKNIPGPSQLLKTLRLFNFEKNHGILAENRKISYFI